VQSFFASVKQFSVKSKFVLAQDTVNLVWQNRLSDDSLHLSCHGVPLEVLSYLRTNQAMGLWLCHVKIQNRKVLFKIKDSYKINTATAQNGLINVLPIARNIGENPKLHLSQAAAIKQFKSLLK
jgi:hypothetical protein